MHLTRIAVSLFEFGLTVVMLGFIIWLTYWLFVKANPDFDMASEIKKGNAAVGTLMASILYAASMILQKGLASVVGMFRLYLSAPPENGFPLWELAAISAGHLIAAMSVALFTVSVTLRLFGKLTRHRLHAGKELERGNLAVGILLASVVLISAMYVSEGVSGLSKALVPQPSLGRIQVIR